MKHRIKFYGCLLGVGLVLVGLVYAFLVRPPAGYRDYRARREAAQARIDGALQSYSANREKLDSPRTPSSPVRHVAQPKDETVDFSRALEELAKQAQEFEKNNRWAIQFFMHSIGSCSILTTEEEFEAGPGPLRPGPALREFILAQAAQRLISYRMAELGNERQYTRAPAEFLKDREKTLRAALDPGMDRAERFLLSKNWQGISKDRFISVWGLRTFAMSAILRAAAHHDEKKCAALLDGLHSALNILHLNEYPNNSWTQLQMQSLLLALDRQGLVPSEKLSHARQILEQGIPTAAQVEDLKQLYAENISQQLQGSLSGWNYHTRYNGWHSLLGGFPEYVTNKSLALLAPASAERLAMAWVNGDEAGTRRQLAQIKAAATLMNFEERSISGALDQLEIRKCDVGFSFNDNVNLTRFILAATWFHHERGRYPERVEELVPDLLDPAFAQTQESTWALLTFPQTSLPVARGEEDDPIVKAANKFHDANNRYPIRATELRAISPRAEKPGPYLADPALLETLDKQVETFAARPVFFQFRRLPAEWTWEKTYRIHIDYLSHREEFDSKNLLRGSGSAARPRLVLVDLRVPIWPSGPDRLLELLKMNLQK